MSLVHLPQAGNSSNGDPEPRTPRSRWKSGTGKKDNLANPSCLRGTTGCSNSVDIRLNAELIGKNNNNSDMFYFTF